MKTTKNNGYSIYNKVMGVKASKKNFDLIILVRNGDFYEAYEEDADQLSGILGLGQYNKKGCILNIAGFGIECLTENLAKLMRAGRKVAIYDVK